METKTESNRQMLRRVCSLSRFAGWAMIVLGILGVGGTVYAIRMTEAQITLRQHWTEPIGQILTGLLVLGTVQFIRYAVEEGTEAKWLLRKGHLILYCFALFVLGMGIRGNWPLTGVMWGLISNRPPEQMIPMGREIVFASLTFIVLVPPMAKALCILGIAVLLRTVLPIVAESKTLA